MWPYIDAPERPDPESASAASRQRLRGRIREVQMLELARVGDRRLEHRQWAVRVVDRRSTACKKGRDFHLARLAAREPGVDQEPVRVAVLRRRLVVAVVGGDGLEAACAHQRRARRVRNRLIAKGELVQHLLAVWQEQWRERLWASQALYPVVARHRLLDRD